MEFRDSLSRLKKKVKKVKHRLTGSKSKLSETGIDVGGERVDSTSSRPSSEPHVVVGGSNDQGGKGPNADGGQILSAIRLPQLDEPSSMSERASAKNQERRGADVDGGEVEQAHSHLDSDVEVAEGRISMWRGSSNLLPLPPSLRSCPTRNPTVREYGYFSYFL